MTTIKDDQGRQVSILLTKTKAFTLYCKTPIARARVSLGIDGNIHVYKVLSKGPNLHIHLVTIGKAQNVFT